MAMTTAPSTALSGQEAWDLAEGETISIMGAINLYVAKLVDVVGLLLDTDGWMGWGIKSPEHFLTWKANVCDARARGIVGIARRRSDLPACLAAFRAGRLTEDAMVAIARRVPASHDDQVAEMAAGLTISQLRRILASLPPLPEDDDEAPKPERERFVRTHTRPGGWGTGEWSLPPDEHALVVAAIGTARDAEFKDRNDLPDDHEVTPGEQATVTNADGLVRLASEGTDALDATFRRTGHRGERHQIVLHQHVDPDGRFGPARLHLSAFVEPSLASYLSCDAKVIVVAWQDGKLLGINPNERTPNRQLRRALEARDGGCAHPLCVQKRWLHAHHIQHWEDDGLTIAANLVMLCPTHHRALHAGDFTISGNPETGPLVFRDKWGRPIEPPPLGADPLPPPPADQLTYRQPYGERLRAVDFSWN